MKKIQKEKLPIDGIKSQSRIPDIKDNKKLGVFSLKFIIICNAFLLQWT